MRILTPFSAEPYDSTSALLQFIFILIEYKIEACRRLKMEVIEFKFYFTLFSLFVFGCKGDPWPRPFRRLPTVRMSVASRGRPVDRPFEEGADLADWSGSSALGSSPSRHLGEPRRNPISSHFGCRSTVGSG